MSTETMERVGVSTFTEIVEQMDFHLACEHRKHDVQLTLHRGNAAWVQERLTLPCCGYESARKLVCDKWVKSCKTPGRVRLCCPACGQAYQWDEYADLVTWVKL